MTDTAATTNEPNIWLQEYEAEGRADCGCRLVSGVESEDGEPGTDGAAFYFCPLHDAASAMLAALEALLRATSTIEVLGEWEALDINARLRRSEREKVDAIIAAARAAIAQARGEEKVAG